MAQPIVAPSPEAIYAAHVAKHAFVSTLHAPIDAATIARMYAFATAPRKHERAGSTNHNR